MVSQLNCWVPWGCNHPYTLMFVSQLFCIFRFNIIVTCNEIFIWYYIFRRQSNTRFMRSEYKNGIHRYLLQFSFCKLVKFINFNIQPDKEICIWIIWQFSVCSRFLRFHNDDPDFELPFISINPEMYGNLDKHWSIFHQISIHIAYKLASSMVFNHTTTYFRRPCPAEEELNLHVI